MKKRNLIFLYKFTLKPSNHSVCRICNTVLIIARKDDHFYYVETVEFLGGGAHCWTDGWVICFLTYWCWCPVMFAPAAFCRALPLKLAHSFPPLHMVVTHWCMYTLSLLISFLCLPLAQFALMWFLLCISIATPPQRPSQSLMPVIAITLSSFRPHHLYFFTFQSHPSPLLYVFTTLDSLQLLSSPLFLTSSSSYLHFYSAFPLLLCLPSSSHHLPLFHPCQATLTVCRMLRGVSIGSCYRYTE